MLLQLILCLHVILIAEATNNGLARLPPMGWLTWERFGCQVNCTEYLDNCINENLIKSMADHIVSDGYKDVGYEYVCIDDCWPAKQRGPDGRLVADAERFPNGMKALADYVHSKGLKIGIYEDFGHETCGGYPGSEFYLKTDAETFADWGIDLVKLDKCYASSDDLKYGFPAMSFFLNQTGRPMILNCEWSYSKQSEVIVGNFGLSYHQERAHMGLWAMWAAPLLMSNDLRQINNQSKALLQNKHLIALNQDLLGIAATLKMKVDVEGEDLYVFTRPLSDNKMAIDLLNTDGSRIKKYHVKASDLGLNSTNGYTVTDGFTGKQIGTYYPTTRPVIPIIPLDMELFIATPK